MRVIIFFIIILASSCTIIDNKSKHFTFENNIWHTDSVLVFDFFIEDTTRLQSIEFEIRHDVDYSYQNLLFFLTHNNKTDTVDLKICEKNGKWTGKGIGSVRTVSYQTKEDIFFQTSNPIIKIEQAMRYGSFSKVEELNSILSFGVLIEASYE